MKKLLMLLMFVLVVSGITSVVRAETEARDSGAVPAMNNKGEVSISLPSGAKMKNVVVFDDLRKIPGVSIGSQRVFSLKIGAGFNYEWSDAKGVTRWQLVTGDSKVGPGLKADCSWKDSSGVERCKYVRIE